MVNQRQFGQLAVYLTEALLTELAARSKKLKRSKVNIVLDAVEQHYASIPEEIAKAKAKEASRLFERSRRPANLDNGKMMNMKVPFRTLESIETLWPDSGAQSRSEYVRTALELHFRD